MSHPPSKRRRPCRTEGASLSDANARDDQDAPSSHSSPSFIPASLVGRKRRSSVATTASGWCIVLGVVTILHLHRHTNTLSPDQPWGTGSPSHAADVDVDAIADNNATSSSSTFISHPEHRKQENIGTGSANSRGSNNNNMRYEEANLGSSSSTSATQHSTHNDMPSGNTQINVSALAALDTLTESPRFAAIDAVTTSPRAKADAVVSADAAARTYWTPLPIPRPQSEQTEPGWAAICAVVKNEELYIDDWIDYHLALGFEHIYLTDNHANHSQMQQWYQQRIQREAAVAAATNSTSMNSMGMSADVTVTKTRERVHLRHRIVLPERSNQQDVIYPECLDHLRSLPHPPQWVMVIDGDEYLVIGDMDKYPNVVSFLTEHVPQGSLQIDWIVMGSSCELQYRKEPVPQRFQFVVENHGLRHHTKAVAVLNHVNGWHIHSAAHKDGYQAQGLGANATVVTKQWPFLQMENDDKSIAAIYHYKYKSYNEFQYKNCVRGQATGMNAKCPDPGRTGTVHDDRAWRAMQRLLPKYAHVAPKVVFTHNNETTSPLTGLCAIVRHESDARYLNEWTDYHLALGFEHIYLFDVQRTFTLPLWYDRWRDQRDNEHRDRNRVRVTHRFMPDKVVGGTDIIYRECHNELRRQTPHPPKYVMTLDINDFFVVRDLDRYPNVTFLLEEHLVSGSQQISSIVMGSANETLYRDAPVTQRFQRAVDHGLYNNGKHVAVLDHIESGYNVSGIENMDVSVAAIYHYKYKSNEEYHEQQCGSKDAAACKAKVEIGTVPDDSVWRAMTRLLPKYSNTIVEEKDIDETATVATAANVTAAATYWTPLPLPRPSSEQTEPGWAAICAIVKNEELYIDDWIDYHLALGFEHVYLTDNHANHSHMQSWYQQRIQREVAAAAANNDNNTNMDSVNVTMAHNNRVHVRHRIVLPKRTRQQHVIDPECLDHLRTLPHPPKWVMVIDGDEYFVIGDMDKYPNAVSFFAEHVPEGSLQIDWIVMGSSYELSYRNEPVPQRFQQVVDNHGIRHHTKAVAVLNHVQGWHVHNAVHKDGYHAKGLGANATIVQNRGPFLQVENDDKSIAAIYHYKYKSYSEFQYKSCVRGRASRLRAKCPDPGQTGTVHDDRAWRAMQRLLPQYANAAPQPPFTVVSINNNSNTAAVCVIARQKSDTRYLSEWTDYHLALGFEHINLFDTKRKFTLSLWYDQWRNQHGNKHDDRNRVHVTRRFMPDKVVGGTEIIYRECLNELRRQTPHPPKYVMALDINDFFVVRDLDRYPNVTSFLNDQLQTTTSLPVSWIVMGNSSETVNLDAPAAQRFQRTVHHGMYPEGKPVAVLDRVESLDKPGYTIIGLDDSRQASLRGAVPCCTNIANGNESAAAIYHYQSKDENHYQCGSFAKTTCNAMVETGSIPDDSVWRAMTRLVPKYSNESDSR